MALIQAKRDKYLGGLDVGDPKGQFEIASGKWWKIVDSWIQVGIRCCQKTILITKISEVQSTETSSTFFITWFQ